MGADEDEPILALVGLIDWKGLSFRVIGTTMRVDLVAAPFLDAGPAVGLDPGRGGGVDDPAIDALPEAPRNDDGMMAACAVAPREPHTSRMKRSGEWGTNEAARS